MKKFTKEVQKAITELQEAASVVAEKLQEQLSQAEEYLEARSEKWQEEMKYSLECPTRRTAAAAYAVQPESQR